MCQHQKAFDPARMGFRIVYRANETNHCPGCGRSHWMVGRLTAECAHCGTALPLENGMMIGSGLFRSRGKTDGLAPLAA